MSDRSKDRCATHTRFLQCYGMKLIFSVICLLAFMPIYANPPQIPVDEPVWSVYSTDRTENARLSVRLGYQNFRTRLNTSEMTPTDTAIALLITTGFQPFFDKVNRWADVSPEGKARMREQYQDELIELLNKLRTLLLKNQHRYTNSLLIDEQEALQETWRIVQEATRRGSF